MRKKLGYKQGMTACRVGAPENYAKLVAPLPDGVVFRTRPGRDLGLAHFFVRKRSDLEKGLPALMATICPDGVIWVSWSKKASKVSTDITEDVVRAVDDIWSGLKLVIRKEQR